MKLAVALGGAAVAGVLALPGGTARADSFTPVSLTITISPIARLHQPLKVTVAVSADAGVLDDATASLRTGVKLAPECGGSFPYTPGAILLDRALSPQPVTGRSYAAQASGSGRPASYGLRTLCVFLYEEGDGRQFATDTSTQVDVSRRCTARAARYDTAVRALARAERELRAANTPSERPRLRRLVATRGRTARADRRPARAACGAGVPL